MNTRSDTNFVFLGPGWEFQIEVITRAVVSTRESTYFALRVFSASVGEGRLYDRAKFDNEGRVG